MGESKEGKGARDTQPSTWRPWWPFGRDKAANTPAHSASTPAVRAQPVPPTPASAASASGRLASYLPGSVGRAVDGLRSAAGASAEKLAEGARAAANVLPSRESLSNVLPTRESLSGAAKSAMDAVPNAVSAARQGLESASRQAASTLERAAASDGAQRAKAMVVDAAPRAAAAAKEAVFGGTRRAFVGLQYRVLVLVVLGVFAYGVGSAVPHAIAEYRLKSKELAQKESPKEHVTGAHSAPTVK